MTFQEKLIRLREKAGLSQAELAEQLGVSRQAVSQWEDGDTFPSLEKLQAIAKRYRVSLDWLCSEDPETEENADPEGDAPVHDRAENTQASPKGYKKWMLPAVLFFLLLFLLLFACVWSRGLF